MSNVEHKECFGKMFPDDLHLKHNAPNEGKVFTVRLNTVGGMLPTTSERSIKINIEQWDDCRQCSEFDSCYKLCIARVTLESTIVNQ
ncbi:MAG TPA: hypothetical protein P5307_21060 [Pirellulaceae bacterium]|nr:hypothetical protein [Planctomycetaceae bacterium]HRX81578.1 hypothetical protein [Pirellulaceae bacterium]